jgi:hypothetical protein
MMGVKRLSVTQEDDFLATSVGRYWIRTEHENDGVSFDDQGLNASPPVLKGIDIGAINR